MKGRPKHELIDWVESIAHDLADDLRVTRDDTADAILAGLLKYRDRNVPCSRKTCKKPATAYNHLSPWCAAHVDKAVFLCERAGCGQPGDYWNMGKRVCWPHKLEARA